MVDCNVSENHTVKMKEVEKIGQIHRPNQTFEENLEQEGDSNKNNSWKSWDYPQELEKDTG